MFEEYNDYALLFKALSDSKRLYILNYLVGGERCACEIYERLNITQSTLSYHMKLLADVNIVQEKENPRVLFFFVTGSSI